MHSALKQILKNTQPVYSTIPGLRLYQTLRPPAMQMPVPFTAPTSSTTEKNPDDLSKSQPQRPAYQNDSILFTTRKSAQTSFLCIGNEG